MKAERAAELIAMLTAKVQPWEPALADFQRLTREDVALALSFVRSVPARLLVRIKYADQAMYVGEFEDRLVSAIERGCLWHAVELATARRWKVPRKDFLRDMCRLAIIEHISPRQCPACGGRGFRVTRKGKLRVNCTRCEGRQHVPLPEWERATLLRIEPDAWAHSWRDRYRAIQGVLDHYEALALGAMAKRVSR